MKSANHGVHLSVETKEEIRRRLLADPLRSAGGLAVEMGVARSTVHGMRGRMIAAGELAPQAYVRSKTGAMVPLAIKPAATRVERIKEMLASGHSIRQIAHNQQISAGRVTGLMREHNVPLPQMSVERGRRFDARRVVEGTVAAAYGIVQGVELLDGRELAMDYESARLLLADLRCGMRALNTVAGLLKKVMTHGHSDEKTLAGARGAGTRETAGVEPKTSRTESGGGTLGQDAREPKGAT